MSKNSGALRRSLAAVLSVLSCGSIAGATKKSERSSGSNVTRQTGRKSRTGKTGKVTARKEVNGNKLLKNQKVKADNLQVNRKQVYVDAVSKKVLADLTVPKTFSGEMRKAMENVKSAWNVLTPWQKWLFGIGGLELLSVSYNGCGFVENVLGTILGPTLQRLGALVFRAGESEDAKAAQGVYRSQYMCERGIENQQGLILGLISKIAFYLKDNYVDFIRAFYHGCKGDPLECKANTLKHKVALEGNRTVYKEVGIMDNGVFGHEGVFDFYNYKKLKNWGPNQLTLFLRGMEMDWKRSTLNTWAYRFGKLFASKKKKQVGIPNEIFMKQSLNENENSIFD